MAPRARRIGKSVHSSGQAALCELLIEARARAGLTQQQLAKKLGMHQSFVAKYEGGERRIDVLEFLTITRAIGADPVRLLKALMRRSA
jgi:transcriptional regulator with XRE-family HTH domain